jgi:glycosyltransferase involved in cell wall biosynthesis
MRVALLGANALAGDALGQQLAEKVAFLTETGAEVRVFVEDDRHVHPVVRPYCRRAAGDALDPEAWTYLAAADLIVADYSQFYSLLHLLPLLAGGKARIVLDYHGVTPPHLWNGPNREPLEQGSRQRGLVWSADLAVTHSRFGRAELQQPTGFPDERTAALGYVIDTDFFQPGPPGRSLHERLGLQAATLLLFVGRLAPNKRTPLLVEALDRLRDLTPPVHAVFIGPCHDVYHLEAERCRQRAAESDLADRVHILGQVVADCLCDAYRSASVFVMPSLHEGFCLPVLEALACGLPVVAARSSALPETVGPAGLTFQPDDVDDLARQVRRVLLPVGSAVRTTEPSETPVRAADPTHSRPPSGSAIAIVSGRYGSAFVGGAETSLRTIATALHQAGYRVEVFATCWQDENDWTDRSAAGSSIEAGITVHRFPLDARDAEEYRLAQQAIGDGSASSEAEQRFLQHSLNSSELLAALEQRREQFAAIIVGPYLFGLTHEVARRFPAQTLLLPCFHDEPAARLPALRETYRQVAGILYHSPEEQAFAEAELGLNHPGAVCCGTFIDLASEGRQPPVERPATGLAHGGLTPPARPQYVVYAGRYSPLKNLPLLFDFARRYSARHPERFKFAFVGQGEQRIPDEPWAQDHGFVPEAVRSELIAGAAALVQLSCLESLSLAALEAWSLGTPVIAHRDCAVLAGQLQRSGGGQAVGNYEEFAAFLDELWEHPERRATLGEFGRQYVIQEYGSRDRFTQRLTSALADMQRPLAERLRERGLIRASTYARAAWRQQFAHILERVLHEGPRPFRERVEVELKSSSRSVAAGQAALLVAVRVLNRGTHVAVAEGLARLVLRCRVVNEGGEVLSESRPTSLPGLIMPGQSVPAAMTVPVPQVPGDYRVVFWAERVDSASQAGDVSQAAVMQLLVEPAGMATSPQTGGTMLEAVQSALAAAQQVQELPAGYEDVTEGWLANWKRRLKSKLLNNFRRAFVEPGFRRQSAFNRYVLTALQELAEHGAALEHAGQRNIPHSTREEELVEELTRTRQRCALLEERLARLEARMLEGENAST